MSSFNDLSRQAQVTRMRTLAEMALAHYPLGAPARLSLLLHLANTTFRVQAWDGRQYVLRICQPESVSNLTPAAIRSEAAWLAALRRDTALGVPEPILTREGDLVIEESAPGVPEPRTCVLFRWLDGQFVRKVGLVKPMHLERTGALMARLHDHAETWTLPDDFSRPCWNAESLVGGWLAGDLGPYADTLTLEDRLTFDKAAARVQGVIGGLNAACDFGLIHADLHEANVLFWKGEARAIDFEDCGFGHPAYDMAVSLWGWNVLGADERRAAFFRGYRRVRSLPPDAEVLILPFIAARYVLITGYMLRRAVDNPTLRAWLPNFAAGAARYLRAWLAG